MSNKEINIDIQEQMWTIEGLKLKRLRSVDPDVYALSGHIDQSGEHQRYECVINQKIKIFFDRIDNNKMQGNLQSLKTGNKFNTTNFITQSHFFLDLQSDSDTLTVNGLDDITPDHTCFVGGTLVHTEQGLIPIQDIQMGDRVLSADPITGQQSYQAVTRVIKTENQSVLFIEFDYWIDPELDFFERRKVRKEVLKKLNLSGIALPSVQFVVTPEHPFWVEGKGWITANQLTTADIVIDKEGNKYVATPLGYNARAQAEIFTTADKSVGMMPDYALKSSVYGRPIDLKTGNILSWNETIKNNLNLSKLYSKNTHWKEDLLEQLPEEDRSNAHFHGFSQGDWVNPETIQWDEGEGYVTTTVYNLEVENTHTYFVGEYGIWVHNCGGEKTTIHNLIY